MYNPIIPYANYTQFTPALPEFYWNVYSAEQRMKHLCMEMGKLISYIEYVGKETNIAQEDIDALKNEFEQFKESGFDDYYKEQVKQWFEEHFQSIMEWFNQHMLFFDLTEDGYFTAYVPEKWAFVFDTDVTPNSDIYGRLQIIY